MGGKEKFDICVIGAGPAGYVAAIRASQLGARTVLIERKDLGGVCLNVGCIPTKTLISCAETLKKIHRSSEIGININGKVEINWKKMLERKDDVIGKLRKGISSLLKAAGVRVFYGDAVFKDKKSIEVYQNNKRSVLISVDKGIVIAAGSEPIVPSFIPQGPRILTSTDLLSIKEIPKSLLIIGGGVIGCEFACLFAGLGTKVTVVEMMDTILPGQEREISRTLLKYMKEMGIVVFTGNPIESVKTGKNSVSGKVSGKNISADYMLISIGRKPNSDGLNLSAAGVKVDEQGRIPVNAMMRTNVAGIYAVGDITDTKWLLAHWASASGICAVENIMGKRKELKDVLTPGCIFTMPEIASVGVTTEYCKENNISFKVGKFPFAGLGKALAMNEVEGFCKIITDAETDQIIGVHIIGAHATDLISSVLPSMNLEITAQELGNVIFPHPTLGEIIMETAHSIHGRCIHIAASRKK